jgi:rhamnulokinase
MRKYLAIDIGASNGRHISGRVENGRIILEEIYRFPNGMTEREGSLCWDMDALFNHVKTGISKCGNPVSVGIDTWGVDFILIDSRGAALGPAVAYRDKRTAGMDAEVEKIIPLPEHYERTGTQKQPFNTIYQLMALKLNSPELLGQADCMLLIPDYLHYRLTGEKRAEYSVASTTGLLNAVSGDWDWDIIGRLGLARGIFPPVAHGALTSHDTAGAFLSIPAQDENAAFISSGTWSLLGIMTSAPILTERARQAGFTNEGGYGGQPRFLKTIMGMWMIQSVRKELEGNPPYEELADMASRSDYAGLVDVKDSVFYAPESMSAAITQKCAEAGYPPPKTAGDILKCCYCSLANEYAKGIRELEALTGRVFTSINIVGGGSRNDFLNRLTARVTGKTVYAGPSEGTALGNIISQMLLNGELPDIRTAHEVIRSSFDIKEIKP